MSANNKKVLIIAYYWPPSGGSGVQRWLKFVKYLPHFGWEPYVFTPENPSFAIKDESLLKDVPSEAEVIHFPIWEPYEFFFKISKISGEKTSAKPTALVSQNKKSFFQSLSIWIRGNLFIPDPRVFWVKPSVKFLREFLEENKISTIITTGPPHSLHLIGLKLKKLNPSLRWIADFRDPWSEWGLLDSLNVGSTARKFHKRLEAKVLSSADDIITITPFYVRRFETLSDRKVHLLTNGFDEDDFKDIRYIKANKFLIRHVGIVNEKCDPRPFMEVVKALINENTEFAKYVQVEFVGEVHPQFQEYIKNSSVLNNITVLMGNIPHSELIKRYGSSSVLLLILTGYKDAEGYMPGKLFEYLATGLPTIGIGPENGDAASVLKEANTGRMIESQNSDLIRKTILSEFNEWKKSNSPRVIKSNGYQYSRKAITERLSELLAQEKR